MKVQRKFFIFFAFKIFYLIFNHLGFLKGFFNFFRTFEWVDSHLQGICIWVCLSFSERVLPGRATWHRRRCSRRGIRSWARPTSTSKPSRRGCAPRSCESFAENSLSLSGLGFLEKGNKKTFSIPSNLNKEDTLVEQISQVGLFWDLATYAYHF